MTTEKEMKQFRILCFIGVCLYFFIMACLLHSAYAGTIEVRSGPTVISTYACPPVPQMFTITQAGSIVILHCSDILFESSFE